MDVPGFAVVTGAASGIGKACAVAFAKERSAGVALLDVSHDALMAAQIEVSQAAREAGVDGRFRIVTHTVNVADEAQVDAAIQKVAYEFGRIDYVVNAAGIAIKHAGGAAFAESSDWQRVLDVNLSGTFYVLKAAAKIMLQQEPILSSIDQRPLSRGSIVNFSSIQGVVGIPLSTSYAATKHGVLGLTRSASEDYAKDGLRINAICPGYTETPMTTQNAEVRRAMQERVETAVPMQRMGRPSEIADGVMYLCGGRGSFVTGSALMVDGGYTQR